MGGGPETPKRHVSGTQSLSCFPRWQASGERALICFARSGFPKDAGPINIQRHS